MKQFSVKETFGKNLSLFILIAAILGVFNIPAAAATLLLPAGSKVNDVAADSLSGMVYITKINTITNSNTLHSSANGVNYTQIALPAYYESEHGYCSMFGYESYVIINYTSFEAITVDPQGTLWAVVKGTKTQYACNGSALPTTQNYLFRRVGSSWVERTNAPNPTDVGVSANSFFQSPTLYATSANNPQNVYYTGSLTGTGSFSTAGAAVGGFLRVDAKNNVFINQPAGAWAVRSDGTLWSFTRNVAQGSPWFQTSQTSVKDVTVNKNTGRIYISKTSAAGGTIWYSDDNGATFLQEPATGFQNLAVTSNGVLYGAGYNGSLWRF